MTLSFLGKGNNPVLRSKSRNPGDVALKIFTRASFEHHVSDLQEILLLSSINHPNIIKILGFETKQINQNKDPNDSILYIYEFDEEEFRRRNQ